MWGVCVCGGCTPPQPWLGACREGFIFIMNKKGQIINSNLSNTANTS